jgi:hypothetical protein
MTARWLVVICTLPALLAGVVAAQGRPGMAPRTVQLSPSLPNDPVRIVKVTLEGVEVKPGVQAWPADKPGVPFQAGDDWFNHLAVVLKNVSTKKIIFGGVQVSFLDLGNGTPERPMVSDQNSVGQRPEHGRYSRITGNRLNDPARDPILVEPGQEFAVPVINPARYESVKGMIESRQPLSSIAIIRIGLTPVYFEDGTKWAANLYYRPDFTVPGKYVIISRNEFEAYRQGTSQ